MLCLLSLLPPPPPFFPSFFFLFIYFFSQKVRVLEVEFAHWARLFAVRNRERDEAYTMLSRLAENRREILVKKTKIVRELEDLRK